MPWVSSEWYPVFTPDVQRAVVTLDAMGTQRAIADQIVQKGGDYLLSVKGYQGRLHDETRDQFAFALRQLDPASLDPARWTFAQAQASGHDRSETRQIMVCHDLGWMAPAIRGDWKNLNCLIMVHRHTLLGAGKTRSETSYYMSSLKAVRAPELCYIRGHWSIENRCHWVLDAIYREDHNQTRDRNSGQPLHSAADRPQRPQPHALRREETQKPAETRTPRHPRPRLARTAPLPSVGTLPYWRVLVKSEWDRAVH